MKRGFVGEAEANEANAETSSKRRVTRGERVIIILAITMTRAGHTQVGGLMSCCPQSKTRYRLWFVSFRSIKPEEVEECTSARDFP